MSLIFYERVGYEGRRPSPFSWRIRYALAHKGVDFDVLITDHLMPGMTGVDLAHLVQKLRPDMPVLLVSGFAESEGVEAAVPRLIKPFRQVELAARLIGLMAERTR